ncbi:Uncharacterised protein [Candidatus Bilamarchaeum dharawalense]|uniref:Uncharacterized protein n=1 Tax=Candidatus Bilamarchaeum dharawalense TaxID=2885759 RepID=A0A5E4LPW7_9ARCH|nr:Uncharacterised protein [Candidatus Bilamarchaeum dharawalense]
MGSSALGNFLLLLGSLIIGVGMTYFSSTIIKFDQQTFIIIAITISIFAFIALYFMAKSRGGN